MKTFRNERWLFDKEGKPVTENRLGVEPFTPHYFRRRTATTMMAKCRTAATLMAAAKIKFEHRERVLNHTMGKLDRIYNQHDFDYDKQVALETLERKINSIITGEKGKVIPITACQKVA